jgi:hypothetical protein
MDAHGWHARFPPHYILLCTRHAVLLLSCRQLDRLTNNSNKETTLGSIFPPSRLMFKEATVDTPLIVLSTRKDAYQVLS